jgi:hypothetical protein
MLKVTVRMMTVSAGGVEDRQVQRQAQHGAGYESEALIGSPRIEEVDCEF